MEYIYAAMLLHKAKKDINEENVKKVLEAAGLKPDDARIKALISSLDGVDIDKIIEESKVAPAMVPPPAPQTKEEGPKKEEKVEEKKEEDAAAGLGALFG